MKVLVIGSGVVGTSCAYYLARSGAQVTLIDQAAYASGCSHGNCGYICPSHVLPLAAPGAIWTTLKTLFQRNSPLKVRPAAVLKNLGWFLGFARRCNTTDMLASAVGIQALLNSSHSLYEDLVLEEKLDCEWDPAGLLFVFHSQKAFDHYHEIDALLREQFRMPATKLEQQQLLEGEPSLKPEAVAGAYLYESDVQVRPDRLLASWRFVLERMGVTIRENVKLLGFEKSNGRATTASTSQGSFACDAFVVAAGALTPQLNKQLGCRVPIVPGKGYSITMPRPKLCPRYPMIFEEHRIAVSPFQSGFRIGSTMEFAGYDDTLNRDRLRLLTEGAAFYLKEPIAEPIQEEWWGWRPMSYDGNPIIDRTPTMSNVIVAAGHGMLGLSMATATGKLVAELLAKTKTHVDPAAYSLNRFR